MGVWPPAPVVVYEHRALRIAFGTPSPSARSCPGPGSSAPAWVQTVTLAAAAAFASQLHAAPPIASPDSKESSAKAGKSPSAAKSAKREAAKSNEAKGESKPTPGTHTTSAARVIESLGVRLELREKERPHKGFIVFLLSAANSSGAPRTVTARIIFSPKTQHECLIYLPVPSVRAEKKLVCQVPAGPGTWDVQEHTVYDFVLEE